MLSPVVESSDTSTPMSVDVVNVDIYVGQMSSRRRLTRTHWPIVGRRRHRLCRFLLLSSRVVELPDTSTSMWDDVRVDVDRCRHVFALQDTVGPVSVDVVKADIDVGR